MAILLYSNGISEEFRPAKLTFSELELVSLFNEFAEIKTSRLITVLNTWCIYGVSPNPDPLEFNRIASDIIKTPVYSHVLFVHDSEINPKWNATDNILYRGYTEFLIEIKKEIDLSATNIVDQFEASPEYEEKVNYLPQLETIGITNDNPKRILFGFNPTQQNKEFYENDEFYRFSQKVYDYIIHNKQTKEPFTIYADKKAIIIVDPQHVVSFLNTMLEKFKSKEEYEACTALTKIIKEWTPKSKKTRRKKSSDESQQV